MLIILIYSLWGVIFFYHQEVITLQMRVSFGTQNTFSETWELKGLSINIHLSGYVHIFKRTRSSETRKRCSFVREFCFGSFSNSSWSFQSHIFIVNGKHDYGVPLKITCWPNKTLYQHGNPFRCTYLYLFWACQLCRF